MSRTLPYAVDLVVGSRVVLHSLQQDPEYNGSSATVVVIHDDEQGKVSVRLSSGRERGRRLKVPSSFLAPDTTMPPPARPSLSETAVNLLAVATGRPRAALFHDSGEFIVSSSSGLRRRGTFASMSDRAASLLIAAAGRVPESSDSEFVEGSRVVLHSLEHDIEYNGCLAVVEEFAAVGDGRLKCRVRLLTGDERGRRLRVLEQYLRPDEQAPRQVSIRERFAADTSLRLERKAAAALAASAMGDAAAALLLRAAGRRATDDIGLAYPGEGGKATPRAETSSRAGMRRSQSDPDLKAVLSVRQWAAPTTLWAPGNQVQLHSLTNDTRYNGCTGIVDAVHGELFPPRYSVTLLTGPEAGRRVRMREDFLRCHEEEEQLELV